jgi:hypothetical protein
MSIHSGLSMQVAEMEFQLLPLELREVQIEVPPSELMTFKGLRVRSSQEILLQITSALQHQALTQRNLVSNIRAENKVRPTLMELTQMFKTDLVSVQAAEYVHVEVAERIAQNFSAQVQSSLSKAQQEVSKMRSELSRVNDKFLEGFCKLDDQMSRCDARVRQGLSHTASLASGMFMKWRQRKLFSAWKDFSDISKLKRLKLKQLLTRVVLASKQRNYSKWARAVTATQNTESRFRQLEVDSQRALNVGKLCSDSIQEIQQM